MKQICIFLLFVTAVLGKPRYDESKYCGFNVIFCYAVIGRVHTLYQIKVH